MITNQPTRASCPLVQEVLASSKWADTNKQTFSSPCSGPLISPNNHGGAAACEHHGRVFNQMFSWQKPTYTLAQPSSSSTTISNTHLAKAVPFTPLTQTSAPTSTFDVYAPITNPNIIKQIKHHTPNGYSVVFNKDGHIKAVGGIPIVRCQQLNKECLLLWSNYSFGYSLDERDNLKTLINANSG